MQLTRSFEQVFEENGEIKLFSDCLYKLLNDLMDGFSLLQQYLGNDKLIDNFKKYKESQEDLASAFQEKINGIDFDIKLIECKTVKGKLHNIKEQNELIENLLYDVLFVDSRFFSNDGNAEEKIKAKPLYDKMRIGLTTLEEVIQKYNIKAEKHHLGKIITITSAREKAVQNIKTHLESQLYSNV